MAVMARRLVCFVLSFAAIWAVAACAAFLGMQVVLVNPAAYGRLADDESFISAIQEEFDAEVAEISQTTHLPQALLAAALPEDEELRSVMKGNLEELPLILGGSRQEYSYSLDAAALRANILAYAKSSFGDQFAGAHATDLELLSEDIARSFESTLRVIDARSIAAMPAFDGALALARNAWLYCIGAAVLAALCIGIVCWLSKEEHGVWLFSIGLCTGLVLLIPVALVEALGLHTLGIEPAAAALLVDHVIRSFETVFAAAAVLALLAAAAIVTASALRAGRKGNRS